MKYGSGFLTGLFFIFYGLIRTIEEPFRNALYSFFIGNINLSYIFSLFMILIGFGIMLKRKFKF